MPLSLPILDDKPFARIAEEARALIPGTAPEWTDHNVHDPGITFIELFAWLAEIQHYRLDRTPAASYARFFSLVGVTPAGARAAEVTVNFEFSGMAQGPFVPANTKIWSVGNESLPFQTMRDLYLTGARLKRVVTKTTGREIVQTNAQANEVGHYEALGPAPAVGDALQLEFEPWFAEPQGQLTITLFEDDLPRRAPFSPGARGFEPSAKVRWEYRADSAAEPRPRWAPLDVIEDSTLSLSRSGELIFRPPAGPDAARHGQLRAVLSSGRYEIPPRIVSVRTNTIRARQVETIVNEDLKAGLGAADQIVRLKKAPVLIDPLVDDGEFQAGEVLDWDALLHRLKRAEKLYDSLLQKEALPRLEKEALSSLKKEILYVANKLRDVAGEIAKDLPKFTELLSEDDGDQSDRPGVDKEPPLTEEEKYFLAQAFDRLLSDPDFYQRPEFPGVQIPEEFLEAGRERTCRKQSYVRRFNRFLLQRVFPDLFVSDRLEVQVGLPAARVEDEPKSWSTWERVDNFLESAEDDRHYVFDPQTGVIRFGNGLNGRAPGPAELIRARFYRHSQLEKGNLSAGLKWQLALQLPPDTQTDRRENLAAAGGREKERLDETKTRAREVFRTQTAILTAGDYESLALNTPGLRVARVKVKPNFNPKLPKLRLPGEVTLIVLPQPPPRQAFPDAPPPEPGEGFLKTIRRHLEGRRLVTTNIHVIGPRYVPVKISGSVFLKKRTSETGARAKVNRALSEFFDPVFGGPDTGKGWPFGRAVFPSEISQQLAKLPEVDYVIGVALNDLKAGESLQLPYNGLPTSAPGGHSIKLVTFETRGQDTDSCEGGGGCG
jgi:hypothetical protein